MTILRTLAFWLVMLPFLARASLAQEAGADLPEPQSDTVSDFASALDATQEGRISRILAETRDQTGVQIMVVTLGGQSGLDAGDTRLEEIGKALFAAWGIGGKTQDGVLILIDTSAHDARITLGTEYPAVYDDRAAQVLATTLLPKLRDGRMAEGIEDGIIAARDRLVLPLQKGEPVGATDGFETGTGSPLLRMGIAALGVLGFLAIASWRRARARKLCPNCGALTLRRDEEVITAPTRFRDGLGLQHLTCPSCGFVDRQSFPIKPSSRTARRMQARSPGSPAGDPGGER